MNKEIACGIVSYNPDIEILKKNIAAVNNQVSKIFVVDNGSGNLKKIEKIIEQFNNVKLIINKQNKGIARALNQLSEAAIEAKYDWLLTLDQDSICPINFVNNLSNYLSIISNVGIVAPVIVDRNVGVIGHNFSNKFKFVRTCITSGALINLKVWTQINGFDEKMFIDSVDFEYCYRVRKAGFKIIQVSSARLNHSIGNAKKCHFLLWKFNNMEHSAFRAYYIAQNNIYYPKKHGLTLHLVRGNYRNLIYIFVVLLYEKDKKKKVLAILKGWKNGYLLH
ncbi:glycosyltransferase family 2 protein [Limosilactobacillus mucosae]|nr:glycosyltransferase family 2 protein [Limosilactobacillus mucosae]